MTKKAGFAAAAAALVVAGGCSPGLDLTVTVYAPPPPALDVFASADRIRITAIGTDEDTGAREILKSREFGVNSGSASLRLIPYARGLQFQVELLDSAGAVTASGASLLHDILRDTPEEDIPAEILVYVSPVNRVVPAVRASDGLQATLPMGKIGMATAVLPDGRILITGGGQASSTLGIIEPTSILRTAEIFDAESGRFITITNAMGDPSPMNFARAYHTATALGDGGVLLAGGLTVNASMLSTLASAEVLEYSSCLVPNPDDIIQTAICGFIPVPTVMEDARAHHTATRRPDGSVLLTGGTFEVGMMDIQINNTTELFTRVNGFAFGGAAPMGTARAYHGATLLPDETILVTGGVSFDAANDPEVLSSVELFTGTGWTPVGAMATPRAAHSSNVGRYPDGTEVGLVAGGYTMANLMTLGTYQFFVFSAPTPLVETYETGIGFNPMLARVTPAMVAIAEHTGTTLPDGRVVLLGGKGATNLATVFAATVDPGPMGPVFVTDPAGVLLTPRAAHAAEVLPGNRVLIIGGFSAMGGTPVTHASGEIYTPPPRD